MKAMGLEDYSWACGREPGSSGAVPSNHCQARYSRCNPQRGGLRPIDQIARRVEGEQRRQFQDSAIRCQGAGECWGKHILGSAILLSTPGWLPVPASLRIGHCKHKQQVDVRCALVCPNSRFCQIEMISKQINVIHEPCQLARNPWRYLRGTPCAQSRASYHQTSIGPPQTLIFLSVSDWPVDCFQRRRVAFKENQMDTPTCFQQKQGQIYLFPKQT